MFRIHVKKITDQNKHSFAFAAEIFKGCQTFQLYILENFNKCFKLACKILPKIDLTGFHSKVSGTGLIPTGSMPGFVYP